MSLWSLVISRWQDIQHVTLVGYHTCYTVLQRLPLKHWHQLVKIIRDWWQCFILPLFYMAWHGQLKEPVGDNWNKDGSPDWDTLAFIHQLLFGSCSIEQCWWQYVMRRMGLAKQVNTIRLLHRENKRITSKRLLHRDDGRIREKGKDFLQLRVYLADDPWRHQIGQRRPSWPTSDQPSAAHVVKPAIHETAALLCSSCSIRHFLTFASCVTFSLSSVVCHFWVKIRAPVRPNLQRWIWLAHNLGG